MLEIRSAMPADHARVLQLNNDAVPAVNELERSAFDDIVGESHVFVVAMVDGELAGFLLGLGPGAAYESMNYSWFTSRFDDFIYVDRIVVAEAGQGRGVGRALYDHFADVGRTGGASSLLAEVNIRPRNDQSLAFHDRYGFEPVGEQDTEGGTKRVVMLRYDLTVAPNHSRGGGTESA